MLGIEVEQDAAMPLELMLLDQGKRGKTGEPRYVFTLLIRDDGLPYSFTESMWSGGTLIEGRATYLFDYETAVAPIELPQEADGLS